MLHGGKQRKKAKQKCKIDSAQTKRDGTRRRVCVLCFFFLKNNINMENA